MFLEREALAVVEANVCFLRWQAKGLDFAVGGESFRCLRWQAKRLLTEGCGESLCPCGGRRSVLFLQVSLYVAWRNNMFNYHMEDTNSALRESHSFQ